MWRFAGVLLVGLVSSGGLDAQELFWRREGLGGQLGRGFEIYRLGDCNGDGWDDMLEVGQLSDPSSPAGRSNAVFITSSQDGSVLSSCLAAVWSDAFSLQSPAPLGDMDQDGVPDYAATVYDATDPMTTQRAEVRSGFTHAILWTATIPNAWTNFYGNSLAGEIDLNGDGRLDLIASATRLSPLGTIITYDNAGTEIYRIVDPLPNVLIGVDVAPLHGDLDGDGIADFLSAGPDTLNRGAVIVFSGKNGNLLRVSYGLQSGDKLSNTCGCGDLDGDGVVDYAGGGQWGASVVTAFSGATGSPIHTWRDFTHPNLGINVMSGFDVDQDGVNDLIAGADQEGVCVMSGRDGTFIRQFWTPLPRGAGWGQVLLAPPPGERYPLIVFSEREWSDPATNPPINNLFPGLLWAYRGNPLGVRAFGPTDASPGFPQPRSGMRDLAGAPVRFTLSEAPPNRLAVLSFGTSQASFGQMPLPAPLDPFGMPGITLLASLDMTLFAITGGSGANSGYASFDLNATLQASSGAQLYSQWLWFDPSDLAISGSTAGQRFWIQ